MVLSTTEAVGAPAKAHALDEVPVTFLEDFASLGSYAAHLFLHACLRPWVQLLHADSDQC